MNNNESKNNGEKELELKKRQIGEFGKFPCPSCGKLVSPNLEKCPYCGKPLPSLRPPPELDPKKLR